MSQNLMHNQLGNRPPQSISFFYGLYVHIQFQLYNLLTQLIIFFRTPSESSPFTHYVNCFQQYYTPKLTLCVDYYSMVCNLFAVVYISTFMWIIVCACYSIWYGYTICIKFMDNTRFNVVVQCTNIYM